MQENNQQFFNAQGFAPNPYEEKAKARIKEMKKNERSELFKVGFVLGTTIILYIIGQVVVSFITRIDSIYELYNNSPIFQNCYSAIMISILSMTIPFLLLSKKLKSNYVMPLVPAKALKPSSAFAWVGFGLGACLVGQIVALNISKVFDTMGYELTQPERQDPDSIMACVIQLITIAIIPAIFEEFSLRGCCMGALRKYGKGFAVFISSIVFGLMHLNLIQFIFAFIIGAILGYITIKTDNIILAMCVHGLNNGISTINTIARVMGGEKVGDAVGGAIVTIWLIVGILGTVVLFSKKEFKNEKKVKNLGTNSFITKVMCTVPGLTIPFIIMIYLTIKSVVAK